MSEQKRPEHDLDEPAADSQAEQRQARGMLGAAAQALGPGVMQRKLQRRAIQRKPAGEAQEGGAKPAAQGAEEAAAQGAEEAAAKGADHAQGDQAEPKADTTGGSKPKVKAEVSADIGFKILKDAFGGLKKDLTQGNVKIMNQADFQVAYDKIYGKTEYSWEKYVKPKFGNLRGLAHDGTNYINKDAPDIDVGTVVHEMLHSNVAGDFSAVVGHQFEEGATEYLTIIAMKKAGEPRTSAYQKQLEIVTACVGQGLSEASLQSAYLVSGAKAVIADWFTGAMDASFSDFKADMEAEDYAKAKAKIKKKAPAAK